MGDLLGQDFTIEAKNTLLHRNLDRWRADKEAYSCVSMCASVQTPLFRSCKLSRLGVPGFELGCDENQPF